MATYRKRPGPHGKTVWQVQIRRAGYPPQSGTHDTKAGAVAWARKIETGMDGGEWVDRSEGRRISLREALLRYEKEILPGKAPRNQVAERRRIHALQARRIASTALANITPTVISSYIRERQSEGVTANTIRLDLATLSHLYSIARSAWSMSYLSNPVALAPKPRPAAGRDRRLKNGEEAQLLAAAPPKFRLIIRFALATAMRRSEIAGLRWEHVNPKLRSAYLPVTKNGEPRTVPLSLAAVAALKDLPRRIDGSVFGVKESTISWTWREVCKKVGITGLTFHDLRHEAISRLFENTDLDAMEIARISGHRTLSMLSRYTHLRAHHLAERMDGAPRGRGRGT